MPIRSYGRRSVETSNEDRPIFPDAGLTKGDLIDHYERVAEPILPFLRARPLVVRRFPEGIDGEGFYQKQVEDHFPSWITTVVVELKGSDETQELVVCDRKAALGFLANQACVELHPWLSRVDRLDRPDQLVIDLDPSGDDFEPVRRAALRVREFLGELDLACFAKLSGSRGVHVVVPLDSSAGFDDVRAFARDAMDLLAERHSDALTTEQRRETRRGRLYLDTGRNAYGQTAVAPWSLRALPGAPLALPIPWERLEGPGRIGPRDYTARNVHRRTARRADPWAGWRRRARALERAHDALERLRSSGA